MIKGVIFDMDGLLVDTEPIWRKAEINIFNELGVPMTEEKCRSVMGLRIDEVVRYWYAQYPWKGKYPEEVILDINDEAERLIRQGITIMPGAEVLLEKFRRQNIPMGLASSSARQIIRAVLEMTGFDKYFSVVRSAENEIYGKPHPAIFLTALEEMELNHKEVVVFEDSLNGVIAAKAARLKTIVVPEASKFDDHRFDFADLKLRSLEDFEDGMFDKPHGKENNLSEAHLT